MRVGQEGVPFRRAEAEVFEVEVHTCTATQETGNLVVMKYSYSGFVFGYIRIPYLGVFVFIFE